MPTETVTARRMPWVVRVVQSRPRMFSSGAVGVVVLAALHLLTRWKPATRFLVAWDIWVTLYLVLVFHMMAGSDIHKIRARAKQEDEGQLMILALTATAALASLAAIVAELGFGATGGDRRHSD